MVVLGLVIARGGSKGLPRKNVLPLGGRPVLVYTIEAALACRSLDDERAARMLSDVPEFEWQAAAQQVKAQQLQTAASSSDV